MMPDSYHSYPKVHSIGHAAIREILLDEVLVEEKVDGSQFSFGVFGGILKCRSKGQQLEIGEPEKMFQKAVDLAKSLMPILKDGWTYRGEYLQKPKHNTLAYSRAPIGNVIIFDINTDHEAYLPYEEKLKEVQRIGLECVPIVFSGKINSAQEFLAMLDRESVLGGAKVEGVVIKNYSRFSKDGKAMMGKFVSEAFKEAHGADWKDRNPSGRDIVQTLIDRFKTEARWKKSVQHLREAGKLEGTPRDIGAILKEAQADLLAECREEIAETLFKWAWDDIKRGSISGLPQWYKEQLLESQFAAGSGD